MDHQLLQRKYQVDFPTGAENTNAAALGRTPPKSAPTKVHSKTPEGRSRPALEELSVGTLQNARQPAQDTILPNNRLSKSLPSIPVDATTPDSLADDLDHFHINSPRKDDGECVSPTETAQKDSKEPKEHSQAPPKRKVPLKAKRTHFALPQPSSDVAKESPNLRLLDSVKRESFSDLLSEPDIRYTIEQHDAKNFDWILSLPQDSGSLLKTESLRRNSSDTSLTDRASQERSVYFGCNLLRQRSQSRTSATGVGRIINTYTLIATPLGPGAEGTPALNHIVDIQSKTDAATDSMIDTVLTPVAASPFAPLHIAVERDGVTNTMLSASLDALSLDRAQSVPRSPCSSVSRIEDTIEELDRLEDQFEAVNRMVRVDRVLSPDKEARQGNAVKPGGIAAGKPGYKAGTGSLTNAAAKASANLASTAVNTKRLSVARPASLLPPKPLAKSSKPSTRPTFELPGEAVARRLKEQREARLAATTAVTAATKPSPSVNAAQNRKPRPRPPTIPTFELPGEAISRRKREEHEAKLRQQEEEERRRREFKARPIRTSINPSTLPRETVASRARQNRASMIGTGAMTGRGLNKPGSGPAGNKRLSVQAQNVPGRRALPQDLVSRGRESTLGSSPSARHTSRTASTSTGSISGQRSTVSLEDVQHQKLRGKEIFQRDNILALDREREKHEREAAAKRARQEAAERSRTLSREWAEKQKLKARS